MKAYYFVGCLNEDLQDPYDMIQKAGFVLLFRAHGGDYYKTVKYLLDKNKLGKVLFPAHYKASSLYRRIGGTYFDYLDYLDVKKKICLENWRK